MVVTEDREAIKGCLRKKPTIMLVRTMLWFVKKLGG